MKWHRPHTLEQALALLAEAPIRPCVIAGGTDLMVERRLGRLPAPNDWLDLGEVSALHGISCDARELHIGAATPLRDIVRHPDVRARWPMLAASTAQTGAVTIQNRATLGGNLVNASPAADNPPVLLAYGAEVELASLRGSRRVPLSDFHTGYRQTAIAADELLVAVHVPAPPPRARWYYRKVGTRAAQAIAKLSLAALYELDSDGVLASARLGMASVAPVPAALTALAAWLRGQRPRSVDPAALRRQLAHEIAPVDDIRSTRDYRLETAARLLEHSLYRLTTQ